MYECENWTIKKAEHRRIYAFELWCWRRLLRVPWTARRSNQSILKEISVEYSLKGHEAEAETPILWPPDAKSWVIWKDPDAGKDFMQEEKGTTEDKIVGCNHQFSGHAAAAAAAKSLQLCPTLCDPMDRSIPGLPVHHQLLQPTQTHVHWVGDAIQPSHPLSSPSPPALNLSQHRGLFKWVSSSHHVATCWSFSFNISPSNEYSWLISFRIDWFELTAVQETLKSLPPPVP